MANLFDFTCYKIFILERNKHLPKSGHGEFIRIANTLGMHPTRVCHIFKGTQDLTQEQACEMSVYLRLSELETEYFLTLVQLSRAGTLNLKKILQSQLHRLRSDSQKISHNVYRDSTLSESDQSRYYSDWIYSAIRLLCDESGKYSIADIASHFKIPHAKVESAAEFLINSGLCSLKNQKLATSTKMTHLPSSSPFCNKHHLNWRLKSIQSMEQNNEQDLYYTCPVSLSLSDFLGIRSKLITVIRSFTHRVAKSNPEEKLACLNMDWFGFG